MAKTQAQILMQAVKVAEKFVSKDRSKPSLGKIYFDGQLIVATSGFDLITIKMSDDQLKTLGFDKAGKYDIIKDRVVLDEKLTNSCGFPRFRMIVDEKKDLVETLTLIARNNPNTECGLFCIELGSGIEFGIIERINELYKKFNIDYTVKVNHATDKPIVNFEVRGYLGVEIEIYTMKVKRF